jgi:hypothetical protein
MSEVVIFLQELGNNNIICQQKWCKSKAASGEAA